MEDIKEMVLQISVLSIIIGIVTAIKPYGKFDSQLKLFTSCLMLIGIFAPFLGSIKYMDTDFFISNASEESVQKLIDATDEEVLRIAEKELGDTLKLKLAEESIPCSCITVCMNTNENKSIDIISVTVVSTKAEEAERMLKNVLGEEVTIYAERSF